LGEISPDEYCPLYWRRSRKHRYDFMPEQQYTGDPGYEYGQTHRTRQELIIEFNLKEKLTVV